jgi:hypothetical protein
MTANHDQSPICKILIGGKREAKESKTITKKFAAAKRNKRLRCLPRARIRFAGRGFSRDIKRGDRENYRLRCLALSFEGFIRASLRL